MNNQVSRQILLPGGAVQKRERTWIHSAIWLDSESGKSLGVKKSTAADDGTEGRCEELVRGEAPGRSEVLFDTSPGRQRARSGDRVLFKSGRLVGRGWSAGAAAQIQQGATSRCDLFSIHPFCRLLSVVCCCHPAMLIICLSDQPPASSDSLAAFLLICHLLLSTHQSCV